MKVQILQLDAHEDLASARDKLAWARPRASCSCGPIGRASCASGWTWS